MSGVGRVLHDRFEIIAQLGAGGMSTVYLARDKNLGSYWAVKQVKNKSNIDLVAFKKEVELLSTLSHADIPRIVDRIEIGSDYFVIMDFIDGTSLGKKVKLEGAQSEKDVIEWAKMLCDVLNYLHTVRENPIVYRDMKPDNVMLTKAGRVKLIDFGIAKECKNGQVQKGESIGTKGYAAPEQYKGGSSIYDERTDIYSLGCTLYTLVTGVVPKKPSNDNKSIRELNGLLSEGLDYIISKCMQVNPEDRYRNCLELENDLNNIEKLNSKYKNLMKNKLISFVASFVMFIMSLLMVFIGYGQMQKDKENVYQVFYQQGINNEKANKQKEAQENYQKAIDSMPSNVDAYIKLFNLLLPKDNDADYKGTTKYAIDTLRKYVDSKHSDMYHNVELMQMLIKNCIAVNDPAYAGFAVEYVKLVKESKEYKNALISKSEIDNYEIIASNCATDISTQDFDAFSESLIQLEENTDNSNMSSSDKLSNYYTIIVMYNTYPTNFQDSYDKILNLGVKSKKIIDDNMQSESLTFNSIIPMYELIASSLYSKAISSGSLENKRANYEESLLWFSYLEDLNDDLSEELELKKGNAYKGIFETYNSIEERGNINQIIIGYLDKSIDVYNNVLKKNSESFMGNVNLTQAYLNKELIKPVNERNFSNAISSYNRVVALKDKNLPVASLSQFTSLKRQMINAGLEV